MSLEHSIITEVSQYCKEDSKTEEVDFINQTGLMNCMPACAMNALIYFGLKSKKEALCDLNTKFGDISKGMDATALADKVLKLYGDVVEVTSKKFMHNDYGAKFLTQSLKQVCEGKATLIYNSTGGGIGHARLLTSVIKEGNKLFGIVKDPLSSGVDKVALEYVIKSIITPKTSIQYMGDDYTIITKT
ncbi:MAG: hypothetical protein JW791_02240 [Nanoarchaeota archaeon]|nr:hypothetical protein [Nanoarchaeota archaeon]